MTMEFFRDVPQICFEGLTSKNPLAFKHYNPGEVIEKREMSDWLRFGVAGGKPKRTSPIDVFSERALQALRGENPNSVELALRRVDVTFEFLVKLGIPFFCLQDCDLAPEEDNLPQSNRNLDQITTRLKSLQASTGIRLLSGTADLSTHARYAFGAATSANADVFAYAAAQMKKAMDVCHELDSQNFVFQLGKEWHGSPHEMDPLRELNHLALFIHLANDYAGEIGFEGQFLFEAGQRPLPDDYYEFDVASCMNFVRQFGMMNTIKLNVEWDQVGVSGSSLTRVLESAREQTVLGGIVIHIGGVPTDICVATQVLLTIMAQGGLASGGIVFGINAVQSTNDHSALFRACVEQMDVFAQGLKIAARIRQDGVLVDALKQRYQSFDAGIGKRIEQGYSTLPELEEYVQGKGEAEFDGSGSQVFIEDLVRRYL